MKLTDAYYKARREAAKWLNSKRDFAEGLRILQNSGYKPHVCTKLSKWGDKPHSREKLVHEVRQMIQAWAKPDDPKHQDVDFDETDTESAGNTTTITDENALKLVEQSNQSEEDLNQYPPVIRQLIRDFSDAYKQRSMLHKQLSEVPEVNNLTNNTKREIIVAQISALSDKMDVLHAFRQSFDEKGIVPSQEEIDSALSVKQDPVKDEKKASKEKPLPESLDELKVIRKSLGIKRTRAQNMLDYQQEAKPKDKKKNPLPESPKRVKYEKKLEQLNKDIERVDYAIAKIG